MFHNISDMLALFTLEGTQYLTCPARAFKGGGGGGGEVPAAHNSKTVNGIEIKLGRIVENHKLINLV